MPTPQEKIAAIQAQTDLQNQAKARANLANVYGKVDAAANQSELANADKFVKTTGMTTLYNTTPTPTGYNPATATPGQQVAAQKLQNEGIDPTKVGTGVGEQFKPYQATQTPMSWDVVGKQKDPASVSAYLNTQPGFKTSIVGNTVVGTKNGVNTTWIYDGANWVTKPTIATGDSPVIGNEPATNVVTTPGGFDTYEAMTPEQRYKKAGEIYMKGGKDVTDEEKQFMAYAQFQGNAGKDVFGLKTSGSSGTTTYSQQLNRDPALYQSSVKNADGTYTVTYKDGATQVITENPTKTVFPEGTPEYYAQKQAEESEKRIQVLTEQANTAEEKRKKDTEELVAKYGENIATQFASQKAEIEANGAKRMDAAQSIYSFSGFGRSSLAAEKRDEIAKNIQDTINQAKAKADLELMAYRMEREGADAEAISAMRTNIANVQQKIDDANYANQLKIIELNQQNATTGAEAMNNLLATISNADELMKDIDFEKSALHGYLVDKTTGKTMFDSQGRPIKFEDSASGLEPNEIQTFSELLKTGKVDIEGLKKLGLNPAEIADISKDYAIQNDTYTAPVSVSDFIAKEEGFRDKAYWDVNGWAVGYGQHAINGKPVVEGQTITKQEADADLANRVANARFNKLITVPLSESQKAALYSLEHNVGGGVWQFASIKPMIEAINKGDFNLAANILVQSGVGTRNAATKEVLGGLVARRQREADLLRQSGGGDDGVMGSAGVPLTYQRRIEQMIPVQLRNSDAESKKLMADIKNLHGAGVSPEDATLMYLGFNVKDEAQKAEAMNLVSKARGLGADLPEDFFIKLSDYVNKGNLQGAKTFTDRIVEGVIKKQVGEGFISTPSLNFSQSTLTRLQNLIEKNKDKIGPMSGRWADLNKKFANDPDYQALSTLISGSNADVRRLFGGTAVTESELKALRDFIGADTKMPIQNLLTALQTNFDTLKSNYDSQRSFYTEDTGTTPTGQTGGEVVESDWWTVN